MVWVSCRVIAEGGSLPLSTVARDLDRTTGTHVKRDLMKRTQRRAGIQALEQGTLVSTTPNIMYKAANCQSKVESEIAPIMATSSSVVLQRWLRPPLRKSSGVRNSQGLYRHHDRPGSFTDQLAENQDVRIQGALHGQTRRTRSASGVS